MAKKHNQLINSLGDIFYFF